MHNSDRFQGTFYAISTIHGAFPVNFVMTIRTQGLEIFVSIILSVLIAMMNHQVMWILATTLFAAQLVFALHGENKSTNSVVSPAIKEAAQGRAASRTEMRVRIHESELSTKFARTLKRFSYWPGALFRFKRGRSSEAFSTAKSRIFLVFSVALFQKSLAASFANKFDPLRHRDGMTFRRTELWRFRSSESPRKFFLAYLAGMNRISVVAQIPARCIVTIQRTKSEWIRFAVPPKKDISTSLAVMFRTFRSLALLRAFLRTKTRLSCAVVSFLKPSRTPLACIRPLYFLHLWR